MKLRLSLLCILLCQPANSETDFSICDSIAKEEGRRLCYSRLGAVQSNTVVVDETASLIKQKLFTGAKERIASIKSKLRRSELRRLEQIALGAIKPIPSVKRNLNLEGYKFLNYLNPKNSIYIMKMLQYSDSTHHRALLSSINTRTDKFTKTKTLYHKDVPFDVSAGSRIKLQIKIDNEGNHSLHVVTIYNGTDWLWVKRVEALVDGVGSLFTYGDFTRDNNSTIWEWRDERASSSQLQILKQIANSKSVTLRYYGEEFFSDKKLSNTDIQAIREMVSLFNEIERLKLSSLTAELTKDFIPQKIFRSVGALPMRCYDPKRKLVYSHSPYGMSCSANDYPISDNDFLMFQKLNTNN